MIGFIIDLVQEIGERLGSGFIRAARRLPLRLRIFLLFALLVLTSIVFYPEPLKAGATYCRQLAMAAGNRTAIPLRGADRQKIDSLIRHLGELLYSAYGKQFEREQGSVAIFGPWDTAQVATALSGLNLPNRKPIDSSKVVQFLNQKRSSDCGRKDLLCWMEGPADGGSRANVGASAWVIYAKARLGVPAESGELRFLLSQQHSKEDSWSMLPCREPEAGSSYATAWSIMALGEQVRRGLVEEPLLSEIQNSMRAGLSWLEINQAPGGLWRTYPKKASELSISNSGLITHVLHHFESEPLPGVESRWMEALSGTRVPAYKAETFNSWICQETNIQRDYTRYIVLPWELIATVDAYPQGSVMERMRAIRLIESVASNKEEILSEIKQEYFMAAELLIALRHLRESFLEAEPSEVWEGAQPAARADA